MSTKHIVCFLGHSHYYISHLSCQYLKLLSNRYSDGNSLIVTVTVYDSDSESVVVIHSATVRACELREKCGAKSTNCPCLEGIPCNTGYQSFLSQFCLLANEL